MPTVAPARANAKTAARPIPVPPPVTNAARPANEVSINSPQFDFAVLRAFGYNRNPVTHIYKEQSMNQFAKACGTIALVLIAISPARAEDKPITVELKKFEFKVAENLKSLFGHDEGEGKLFFYTNGAAVANVDIPADSEYEITIKASCTKALNEFAKFKLSINGELVGKETALTAEDEKEYKFTAKCKKGDAKLSIEFTNDVYKENEYDRNLWVHAVTLKKK
jgi:Ca-dependent carbohydrate-binding module xylan-binding